MPNNYEILGVSKSATKSEIKKAYHKLALIYHPERPNGNVDKFLKIKDAYEALTLFNPNTTHNIFTRDKVNTYINVDGQEYDSRTNEILIYVSFSRDILQAYTVGKKIEHKWGLIGLNGGTMALSSDFVKYNGFTFDIHFLTIDGRTIIKSFDMEDPRSIKTKFEAKYLDTDYLLRSFCKGILFIVIYYLIYNLIF